MLIYVGSSGAAYVAATESGRRWISVAAGLLTLVALVLVVPKLFDRDRAPRNDPATATPRWIQIARTLVWVALLAGVAALPGRWGVNGRDYGVSMCAAVAIATEASMTVGTLRAVRDGQQHRGQHEN